MTTWGTSPSKGTFQEHNPPLFNPVNVLEGKPVSSFSDKSELSLQTQIKSLQEAQVKQRLEFRLFSIESAAIKSQLDTITNLIKNMSST